MQLGISRSSLRSATLTRRAQIVDLSVLLRVLRSFRSLADLLDGAPAEIHRVGFGRVLLSRVQDGLWRPRSCSVVGDPELARQMVRIGAEYPGTLNGAMVESEMVRRQQPIRVRDAARPGPHWLPRFCLTYCFWGQTFLKLEPILAQQCSASGKGGQHAVR